MKTSSTSSHLSMSCPQLALKVFYILLHTRACAHSNKTMLPATGPLTEWLKVRTYIARQTASDKEAPKSFIVLTYGCILNLRVKQLLHQGALTPDIPKTFLRKVFTPNPPAQVQRACLSGGTSNRSALAGGVYTFLAGKMHGTFIQQSNNNLQHFGPRQAPPIIELELCSKDCDKKNVDFRCSLAIFCDLTPS